MKAKLSDLSLEQMKKFAEGFAKTIKAPMIVLLHGDLGSGKTTFVREVAKALGCEEDVTSPTFSLMNTYEGKEKVYHFDMYRLSSAEEARGVGFEEYFDKKTLEGVCFVEWPENVEGLFTEVDFDLDFVKTSDTTRTIIIREGA